MAKEVVTNSIGQNFTDRFNKMGVARNEAELAIKAEYGDEVWQKIQHRYPGTPPKMTYETEESLRKALTKEFWEQDIARIKNPEVKKLFIASLFSDPEKYE